MGEIQPIKWEPKTPRFVLPVDEQLLPDEDGLRAYLQLEMERELEKAYFQDVLGPILFGQGNFNVTATDTGGWELRPNEDFKPAQITGILNYINESSEEGHIKEGGD